MMKLSKDLKVLGTQFWLKIKIHHCFYTLRENLLPVVYPWILRQRERERERTFPILYLKHRFKTLQNLLSLKGQTRMDYTKALCQTLRDSNFSLGAVHLLHYQSLEKHPTSVICPFWDSVLVSSTSKTAANETAAEAVPELTAHTPS